MSIQSISKYTFSLELNGRSRTDGTHTILLRISCRQNRFRISTGQSIEKKYFKAKAKEGKWVTRHPNHKYINSSLQDFIQDVKNTLSARLPSSYTPNMDEIKHILEGPEQSDLAPCFMQYFKEKIDEAEITKSVNYWNNLGSKYRKLKGYLNSDELLFRDLTHDFLKKYQTYLISKGNSRNTLISNFKDIRTIFYLARKEGVYTDHNPFEHFEVGVMKSTKLKLSKNDISKIEELELEVGSRDWHTRNYFLFAFYGAGIRIGDLMKLRWENIVDGRIEYNRSKTSDSISIKILDPCQKILNFYWDEDKGISDFIFPILPSGALNLHKIELNRLVKSKTASINSSLKSIQRLANISITITTHISRHSYASILRDLHVDTHDIMKLLGHSSISVTETYLDSMSKITSDESHTRIAQ